MKFLIGILVLLLIGGVFAGCAAVGYQNACNFCSFNSQGKIEQQCYESYKTAGTTCTGAQYPITSAKYANGKCPQVDGCISELDSCTTQYRTGNDEEDCKEGSLAVCFAAADECMKQAAVTCGEIQSPCPGSGAAFVLLFGMFGFLKIRKN